MAITTILRRGARGSEVERWQQFLIGRGLLKGRADGDFGAMTEKASKAFQKSNGIIADGIIGPQSYAVALRLGFDPGLVDTIDPTDTRILSGNSTLKPLSAAQRQKLFGVIEYDHTPTPGNREAITITNGWERDNITRVAIPQLKGIPVFGKPGSGQIPFHTKAAAQLQAMWGAWQAAGLLERVLTYEGSYNPRLIRGGTSLSNHAYGTAFDINYNWNRLGQLPTAAGKHGSVRELVPIANEYGFFWGGHFKARPDGMHFEVARLL
jgi:peptidoglycan hydrolase-like protein with peptidoglycan-binding domain